MIYEFLMLHPRDLNLPLSKYLYKYVRAKVFNFLKSTLLLVNKD